MIYSIATRYLHRGGHVILQRPTKFHSNRTKVQRTGVMTSYWFLLHALHLCSAVLTTSKRSVRPSLCQTHGWWQNERKFCPAHIFVPYERTFIQSVFETSCLMSVLRLLVSWLKVSYILLLFYGNDMGLLLYFIVINTVRPKKASNKRECVSFMTTKICICKSLVVKIASKPICKP